MTYDLTALALLSGIFLFAGTVKGMVGIGLPTAAVGMMSQVIDPRAAISLVVLPSLLSNAWQILRAGGFVGALRRYAAFLICLCGLILMVSMTLTARIATDALILVLGCVIVVFSALSLAWSPPMLSAKYDRAGQVVAGSVAGALGGLTAIWAPPMIIFLTARRADKDEFVRATGVMIFIGTIPLLFGFWQSGMLRPPDLLTGLFLTIPALLGFQIGERLRRFLDTEKFRTAVLVIFLLLGFNLIRRALL